jgi:hypothetical protein
MSNFGLQDCKRKYLCGLWSFVGAAIGNGFIHYPGPKAKGSELWVLCLERGFLL